MRQLGSLKCVDIIQNDDAPWIVLFHGYGADAHDLAPLAESIQTSLSYNWLFPEGFLEIPIDWSSMGRAWWPIDMEELQKSQLTGVPRDLSQIEPKGLTLAYQKASEMLSKLKVPWNKVILGGFSQGAMLATELYLQAPESPMGLIVLSGTCLKINDWKEKAKNRAGKSFFLSHGEHDPILSIKGAQKIETILTQSGMKGRLIRFQGGHEIPMKIITEIGTYLNNIKP